MQPDALQHHVTQQQGQAAYLRALIAKIAREHPSIRSQRGVAEAIGVGLRTLVDYLTGVSEAPYPVQFAIERLAMTPKERDDAQAEDEAFKQVTR